MSARVAVVFVDLPLALIIFPYLAPRALLPPAPRTHTNTHGTHDKALSSHTLKTKKTRPTRSPTLPLPSPLSSLSLLITPPPPLSFSLSPSLLR